MIRLNYYIIEIISRWLIRKLSSFWVKGLSNMSLFKMIVYYCWRSSISITRIRRYRRWYMIKNYLRLKFKSLTMFMSPKVVWIIRSLILKSILNKSWGLKILISSIQILVPNSNHFLWLICMGIYIILLVIPLSFTN